MKVLKIKANTMQDALVEARRQLGDGVTVLHTKQYDDATMLGLARKPVVEILAAADAPAQPVRAQTATATATVEADWQLLSRQIADVKRLLGDMDETRPQAAHPKRSPILERLVSAGVDEALAGTLVAGAKDDQEKVVESIKNRFNCSGPIGQAPGQARVAIVGPTGAGKTTTAAKLAARCLIIDKKSVALLTVDTYRVGAVEQLGAYARILEVPLEVGMCPEDVDALIQKHSDKDVIIIDTVGRSQRDGGRLSELERTLRPAKPTEVHLAVSAQASQAAQKEALDAFRRVRVDRMILTKIDECPQPGCALNLAVAGLLPYSYLTYGQDVPDDIAVASKDMLARLVWEGTL
jgi:flagellar biosynthesis protein FlhF